MCSYTRQSIIEVPHVQELPAAMENLHSYSLHSAIGHLFIDYGGALVRSGDPRGEKSFSCKFPTLWDSVIYLWKNCQSVERAVDEMICEAYL